MDNATLRKVELIFDKVMKEAELRFDHQSLSSLEVTNFIRDRFEDLVHDFYLS